MTYLAVNDKASAVSYDEACLTGAESRLWTTRQVGGESLSRVICLAWRTQKLALESVFHMCSSIKMLTDENMLCQAHQVPLSRQPASPI